MIERYVRPLTEAEMRDYLANHADDALRGDNPPDLTMFEPVVQRDESWQEWIIYRRREKP